jgi:hypothetical protein
MVHLTSKKEYCQVASEPASPSTESLFDIPPIPLQRNGCFLQNISNRPLGHGIPFRARHAGTKEQQRFLGRNRKPDSIIRSLYVLSYTPSFGERIVNLPPVDAG